MVEKLKFGLTKCLNWRFFLVGGGPQKGKPASRLLLRMCALRWLQMRGKKERPNSNVKAE